MNAIIVQAACIALSVWFLLKFLWIMIEVERAFRSGPADFIKIIPKFDDEEKRYGIMAFDPAYRSMVAAIGVGAWWFPFNYMTNVEKGEDFLDLGNILALLVLLLCVVVLAIYPVSIPRQSRGL
ncbi:MAG TPA: hypothetical protein VN493_03390 [Thermoanaerobaculia bacterium]|nr:hypothetical protein [Thermoanaerobaculia bacterium]